MVAGLNPIQTEDLFKCIARSTGDSNLPLGVIISVTGGCVGPAMDWGPIQGVFPSFALQYVCCKQAQRDPCDNP